MGHILVTGVAGFIGFHLATRLLKEGYSVIGIDNMNDYYDVALKNARLSQLQTSPSFSFYRVDVANRENMTATFESNDIEVVIHLAAQAGVRYSITNPHVYIDSNISGFLNIVENCRCHNIQHLLYASTSAVYGANTHIPFSTCDSVDHPISVYAVTKRTNELLAHTYAHLYNLPCTGMRFFYCIRTMGTS
jgi:UDP-glucuronate 4-epimerase